MRFKTPHPIPYQGSKRILAPAILSFVPASRFERLIEPFAGSAAVTLAAAQERLFQKYVIGDLLKPLTDIWLEVLTQPSKLSGAYSELWRSQARDPAKRFNEIRAEFNEDHDPAKLLFLLARCVKNAVRFSTTGQFNQSPDRRRRGVHPGTMAQEIHAANRLLKGKCKVVCADFREVVRSASRDDLVYMDPPYQGISDGRDRRYIKGVQRGEMITMLEDLNDRGVEYILSYDGYCGEKCYGEPLPARLGVHRILLEVGRSSQATLNGRDHVTGESIYLSPGLSSPAVPNHASLSAFRPQIALFS
jgi:DNA adenine methylase